MVPPLTMKYVEVDIFILLWFPTLYGPFVLMTKLKNVRCSTVKINFLMILNSLIILVSINELMEQGLVNFHYTKLCFTVGGEATDPRPNKVYQSVRVS